MHLIQIFIDIALLRKGPQHLPSSQVLSLLCLVAYFFSTAVYLRAIEDDASLAIGWAFISVGMLSFSVALLLAFRRRLVRFRQTLSAFAGTGTLLTLILLPIAHAITNAQGLDGGTVSAPIAYTWLALFIWSFVLDAHIYRHSLSISFTEGMLVTCILFAVSRVLYTSYVGSLP